MYLLIDTSRMCVTHRHEDNLVLRCMAHIELSYCSVFLFDEQHAANYQHFSMLELRMLHSSIVGKDLSFVSAHAIIQDLQEQVQKIQPSEINLGLALLQAAAIAPTEPTLFRYKKGAHKPQLAEDGELPPALMAHSGPLPLHPAHSTNQATAQPVGAAVQAGYGEKPQAAPYYPPPWGPK